MRSVKSLLGLGALSVILAACGGSHSTQRRYHTHVGVQAHSPSFGLPPSKPGLLPPVSSAHTLGMLDSVESSTSIFSGLNPVVVAGYTSGSWPTYFDYKGHFKYVVAIMVNTSHFGIHGAAASCLDVEPGDASPSEVGSWMLTEIKNGFRPCAYGSLSEMPAIKSNITSHGISLSKVLLWDADWTYSYHIDSGYAATQWTDHFANRNIDGSAVTPNFVNAKPTPPPPSRPKCFGSGWQHTSFCSKVRQQDAVLGKVIAKEQGYLKVSEHNLALIQGRIKVEQGKVGSAQKALDASLKKYGYTHH